ncbi:pilus assembly protein TadG-related protein [Novosphingobium sp. 1949]|uniref:Pilus assembly protein TadG-related protein n=1 Tax=Novosphingobium organovorum TaxID=2930092 RepID=A0ABT0BCK7_9SPHN|nr:pilus assembly protein TadG-related protein [Novosphingobium organovorum]MCJ2182610.1 pilus assembly protein TadG-related protein [Novosphingobium organovorum]
MRVLTPFPIAAILHRLDRDTRGAVTVLLAGSLLMLMGIATVSVDLGSIYLAQRKLQGIADAAAMAAAQQNTLQLRRAAAQGIIDENAVADVSIAALENGTYTQDKAIAVDQRFQPGGDESAARVDLVQTVPMFFGRALGFEHATVRAQATAAKIDMAAYSLGTSLASLSGGIPNALLSALIGTQLNLSVLDTQNLASAQVDLLGFADAVKAEVNAKDVTYAELFDTPIALGDALRALAASAGSSQAAAVLADMADQAPLVDVTLGQMIELGPYGRLDYSPGKTGVEVDAFSLARTLLELSHGDSFDITFALSVSGLSNVTVHLVRGYGVARSPWLTITSARDYVLRTAQARLLVAASASTGNPLLPSLTLPLYAELAQGQATLDDIQCTGDADSDGVTLGVSPALGTVGIGTASAADMADLTEPVTLSTATLVQVPLIAKVTALSQVSLGGTTDPQEVLFTLAEIRAGTTKTVGTNDLTQSLATSLIKQTNLQAQTLGLTLSLSSVTAIVGNTLAVIAPTLDQTVTSLTQALGIRLGAADVTVNQVRCGIPMVTA